MKCVSNIFEIYNLAYEITLVDLHFGANYTESAGHLIVGVPVVFAS